MKLKERYELNKSAKVGTDCICPSCNSKFVKTNYQQAFCKRLSGTQCKDKYWNTVTPTKRNNTTRISPANALYKATVILPQKALERGFPNVTEMLNYVDEFNGEWGEHNCHVLPCEWCGLRSEYCRCD